MRASLSRLLFFVDAVVACGIALLVLVAWLAPGAVGEAGDGHGGWQLALHWSPGSMTAAGWLAAALVAANVAYAVLGRQPRAPLRHVVSQGSDGPVLLQREALENALRASADALEVVARTRVHVRQAAAAGRRMVVHVQFAAPDGVAVHDASEALRRALHARLRELMPVGSAGAEFELEFVGFSGRAGRRPPESPPPAGEPAPFTGPQYPIDEDERAEGAGWDR